jgi:hypothetical protein
MVVPCGVWTTTAARGELVELWQEPAADEELAGAEPAGACDAEEPGEPAGPCAPLVAPWPQAMSPAAVATRTGSRP